MPIAGSSLLPVHLQNKMPKKALGPHPVEISTFNIKIILYTWILKTSLDLTKSNTKTWFKKKLNDWFSQIIAFSNQPLHRIKFLMDFNWIRHTSAGQRRLLFIASAIHAKIIALSYTQFCLVLSCQFWKYGEKKVERSRKVHIWRFTTAPRRDIAEECIMLKSFNLQLSFF